MKRHLALTLVALLLIGFIAGCVMPTPGGDETRTCSVDSDCVPEQCCHPTSCINKSYKGVCNELCTAVCDGPIDCGAGHCGCVNGTCQVLPGPSQIATYIVGIDADYPPFTYIDLNGTPAGFDVDSVQWIAQEEGFKVDFQPVAWNDSISALLAGKIDMIYSGMSMTDERKQLVNFSIPYWKVNQSVATHVNSTWTMQEFFAGDMIIGAQRGTPGQSWVEDHLVTPGVMPSQNLVLYDSLPLVITDLQNWQIDAAIAHTSPMLNAIEGKPLHIIGEIDTNEVYGVAVRKEDTELLSLINDGLTKLMNDPYWNVLIQNYDMK
jgi:polar amino acid transport system substrate-binding protein